MKNMKLRGDLAFWNGAKQHLV